MGVWDLKGLFDEIKKWEKRASDKNLSDSDRQYFLRRAEEAREAYRREQSAFEVRATIFEEAEEEK